MLLSAMSVLVVAQSSSEIAEGLMITDVLVREANRGNAAKQIGKRCDHKVQTDRHREVF